MYYSHFIRRHLEFYGLKRLKAIYVEPGSLIRSGSIFLLDIMTPDSDVGITTFPWRSKIVLLFCGADVILYPNDLSFRHAAITKSPPPNYLVPAAPVPPVPLSPGCSTSNFSTWDGEIKVAIVEDDSVPKLINRRCNVFSYYFTTFCLLPSNYLANNVLTASISKRNEHWRKMYNVLQYVVKSSTFRRFNGNFCYFVLSCLIQAEALYAVSRERNNDDFHYNERERKILRLGQMLSVESWSPNLLTHSATV